MNAYRAALKAQGLTDAQIAADGSYQLDLAAQTSADADLKNSIDANGVLLKDGVAAQEALADWQKVLADLTK